MIPRPFLVVLVYALPMLVVAFGVLMGSVVLVQAVGDSAAAVVLRWIALSCFLLLVIDLLLLIGVLGINALAQNDDSSDQPDS